MKQLLNNIQNCNECAAHLPLGPRPILSAYPKSKVVIIGQAPGKIVHETGIPWNDKSGENLRQWMGIDSDMFYNSTKISILPMGFCYPGKGKSGDLPPRKECAPLWHQKVLYKIEQAELILLIGKYAQDYYLNDKKQKTLTDTVLNFRDYLPKYFVLPHPSPRNNIWMTKNPWFESDVLPELKRLIKVLNFKKT
ncbi:uracil-DNA glycosylase family protein [Gaetbulibacter sp. M235]|uniref:uracil-DNA glycosylase family protein n=1 Tax=Gaetbulibacter sp. M235 TaxID=3126510 RepID=UPI00374F8AF8